MLFDKNYNKLIEILGKYDENFLKDYNEFIAKFPAKLIEKAEEGKEFSKKVKGSKLSCFIDDKYNEYIASNIRQIKQMLRYIRDKKHLGDLFIDINKMSIENIFYLQWTKY